MSEKIFPCLCRCHPIITSPSWFLSLESAMNAQARAWVSQDERNEHCEYCCNGAQMCDDCLFYAAQDGESAEAAE